MTTFIGRREFITLLGGAAVEAQAASLAPSQCAASLPRLLQPVAHIKGGRGGGTPRLRHHAICGCDASKP
jgi:hypothetical protein